VGEVGEEEAISDHQRLHFFWSSFPDLVGDFHTDFSVSSEWMCLGNSTNSHSDLLEVGESHEILDLGYSVFYFFRFAFVVGSSSLGKGLSALVLGNKLLLLPVQPPPSSQVALCWSPFSSVTKTIVF